jgi:TonB family protein
MFTMLSQESVSETPGKAALYASCTIHFCALIVLALLSISNVPKVRFEFTAVHAGSEEPVRQPQPLYAPVGNLIHIPSERTQRTLTVVPETPRQAESNDSVGFTPTAVEPGFLTLLDMKAEAEAPMDIALAGTRAIPLLMVTELLVPPPEPPPGEPDIKPPPIIGGRVEPAELIKQTIPTYPPLARTARIEGVVVLQGTVSVSGSVEDIHVVDGHPLLIDEAVRAVKRWKYRPAMLNGQPTPCPVNIQVRFTLKYPRE